jgi:peptidoglycan/LPS O-acetylase OafA/YrhL
MEVALNLTAMFLGKVMRDTVVGGRLRWWHVAIAVSLYCVFAITISFKLYGGEYRDNFFFGYSIGLAYIGAAAVFVVFASFGERMSWRFMAFVGMISYSVYLMSPFVIVWMSRTFDVGSRPAEWELFILGAVALSILVSWLTYSAVEKPLISFGHRFRSRSRPVIALESPLSSQGAE